MRRPPRDADRFVLTAHSHKGQHVVQDVARGDIDNAVQFANAVVEHAKKWARAEGHETRFLATWAAGQRVLGSYQWAVGDGRPPIDGTALSQIVQSQSHAEVMHRFFAEQYERISANWERIDARKDKRIEQLEKECDALRERLRRADDVDATIITQQAEAELERSARNQAILEERVLPLVENVALRLLPQLVPQLNLNGATPPTAAAAESEQQGPATEQ